MSGAIRIQGDRALIKALNKLPSSVRRQAARKALRGTAAMVNKEMKSRTPADTTEYGIPEKLLRKSIGRKRKTFSQSGVVMEVIGPRNTFRMPNGQAVTRYAQFVERGTASLPARPFARTTADAVRSRAIGMMTDDLRRIVREAAKKR